MHNQVQEDNLLQFIHQGVILIEKTTFLRKKLKFDVYSNSQLYLHLNSPCRIHLYRNVFQK